MARGGHIQRKVALICIVAGLAADGAAQDKVFRSDDPYQYLDRLELVNEMSAMHRINMGQGQRLGSWAGIYYFTKWQYDSRRDLLPIWELVNRSFTYNPYEYSCCLELGDIDSCLSEGNRNVCQNWITLFEDCSRGARPGGGQLLWNAHVTALRQSIKDHGDYLATTGITEDEMLYWRGRIRLIYFLSAINYPTRAHFVRPIVRYMEPPCAPLGGPGCEVKCMDTILRRAYLRLVMQLGRKTF